MANNPTEPSADEFLEQILSLPNFPSAERGLSAVEGNGLGGSAPPAPMMLQLNSGDGSGHTGGLEGGGPYHTPVFPLGLSLDQGGGMFLKPEEVSGSGKRFREEVGDGRGHSVKNVYHGHPVSSSVPVAPHPPAMRPRIRARRGQATDPHSIAERLRRERIAERIRALQELVPSVNKTDRAAMLDEIVDYVKFLKLQVKVLSISRLGGAGAVAPLVTDIPLSSLEEGGSQPAWEKWSTDGTERQVAKLMEENVGSAMQFLQSKSLCMMPISLASAIYHTNPPDTSSSSLVKSENNTPS